MKNKKAVSQKETASTPQKSIARELYLIPISMAILGALTLLSEVAL